MRYKIPLREAGAAFDQRRPFDCNGTLIGHAGPPRTYGWLTGSWVNYLRRFAPDITYTVMSYYTPIAVVLDDDEVVVPPLRHSITTQRHVRALGVRYSHQLNPGWGVAA